MNEILDKRRILQRENKKTTTAIVVASFLRAQEKRSSGIFYPFDFLISSQEDCCVQRKCGTCSVYSKIRPFFFFFGSPRSRLRDPIVPNWGFFYFFGKIPNLDLGA